MRSGFRRTFLVLTAARWDSAPGIPASFFFVKRLMLLILS